MPKNAYFSNLDPDNIFFNLNLVHTPQENVVRRTLEKNSKPENVVIRTCDVINGVKMTIFCYFSLVQANFTHLDHCKGINDA